jgi:HEXXH motif-containing protein
MMTPLPLPLLLASGSPAATRLIVANSGAKLLRSVLALAQYLLAGGELEPSERKAIEQSVDALAARDEESLFVMLASPIFRGWYSAFGRLPKLVRADPRFPALIALWNNHLYDLVRPGRFRVLFAVVDGWCWSSDCEILIRCPGHQELLVEKDGTETVFYSADGSVRLLAYERREGCVPRILCRSPGIELCQARGRLPDTGIPVRNDIPPLCLHLAGWERDTAVTGELDLSAATYDHDFALGEFITAADLIRRAWPEQYDDLRQTLQIVVPRNAPSGWRAHGMTVSSYQGAVWLMAKGVLPLFENLIHEQSHVKLRYIEDYVGLLESEQEEKRFEVSWRSDPRPLKGIFEGIYVHLQMLEGLTRLLDIDQEVVSRDAIVERIARLTPEIGEGLRVFSNNARLTSAGREFVRWCEARHAALAGAARLAA